MASPEYNIESLIIAILQNSATFSGVNIEHHVEDADTVSKGKRITVKCEPKTPLLGGRSPSKPVLVWQADITVTAVHNGTETAFDAWRDAIDDELNATSYPASVVTSATSLFPNGIELTATTGGTVFEDAQDRRSLTRQLRAIFQT